MSGDIGTPKYFHNNLYLEPLPPTSRTFTTVAPRVGRPLPPALVVLLEASGSSGEHFVWLADFGCDLIGRGSKIARGLQHGLAFGMRDLLLAGS